METVKLGITVGDINGVGLEVILKTLSRDEILNYCTPVIYGSSKVVSYHKNIVKGFDITFQNLTSVDRATTGRINVLNCWQENVNITLGKETPEGGKYAYIALDQAARDLAGGKLDGLVTGPVSKHAMTAAGFKHRGHTDYLEEMFSGESLMMMIDQQFRIAVLTHHIPLAKVPSLVTAENLKKALQILVHTLRIDFGLERPTVAILGLNPHAGERGLLGDEEENMIRPVLEEFRNQGHLVMGPFSADGFFGSGEYRKFDAVLAMYHDQGLIPFKTISFESGVNFTAGLDIVRTSPDHGVAYDLAGQNSADPTSFRNALFLAIDVVRSRRQYREMTANPLSKQEKPTEID